MIPAPLPEWYRLDERMKMRLTKQMVVNEFGRPEVLALVELPVRSPKAGEILVRVEAAGVL